MRKWSMVAAVAVMAAVAACGDDDDGSSSADCADAAACLVECGGDETCAASCAAEHGAEAVEAIQAINACDQEYSCNGAGACMSEHCQAELDVCGMGANNGNGGSGGGSGGEGLTCAGIVQCYATCADAACFEACYDKGTAGAQALYDAMFECAENCQTEDCSECQDEQMACATHTN